MAGTARALPFATAAVAGALLAGCASLIPPVTVTATQTATRTAGTASATSSDPGTPPTPTRVRAEPSSAAIEYAESLGGTSHAGETLFLVVGGTFSAEKDAQAALDDALPRFGDMQAYFIVQTGDNFDGLTPGTWVVIEAYHDQPPQEDLQFDHRGFPRATVVQASVNTEDPIPVVEDVVG